MPSYVPVDDEPTRMQEVKLQRVINGWKLSIMYFSYKHKRLARFSYNARIFQGS